MAIYYLNLSGLSRSRGQSAASHASYVCRLGRYARGPRGSDRDVVLHVESGAMPGWARDAAGDDAELRSAGALAYWSAADAGERANGRLAVQIELALPRELPLAVQIELARAFALEASTLPDGARLPHTWAIHEGRKTNPHVHLLISERINDGVERGPEVWFKRTAVAGQPPETGGARKARELQKGSGYVDRIRERWAELANAALERAGQDARIDHRTLEAQGIDRLPMVHEGWVPGGCERAIKVNARRRSLNDEVRALRAEAKRLIGGEVADLQWMLNRSTQARASDLAKDISRCQAPPLTNAVAPVDDPVSGDRKDAHGAIAIEPLTPGAQPVESGVEARKRLPRWARSPMADPAGTGLNAGDSNGSMAGAVRRRATNAEEATKPDADSRRAMSLEWRDPLRFAAEVWSDLGADALQNLLVLADQLRLPAERRAGDQVAGAGRPVEAAPDNEAPEIRATNAAARTDDSSQRVSLMSSTEQERRGRLRELNGRDLAELEERTKKAVVEAEHLDFMYSQPGQESNALPSSEDIRCAKRAVPALTAAVERLRREIAGLESRLAACAPWHWVERRRLEREARNRRSSLAAARKRLGDQKRVAACQVSREDRAIDVARLRDRLARLHALTGELRDERAVRNRIAEQQRIQDVLRDESREADVRSYPRPRA